MKKVWLGIAGACAPAAALAFWWRHVDAAFVIATVGALAWFLSYRARIRELVVDPALPADRNVESAQSNED